MENVNYFKLAQDKGTETGKFVASLKTLKERHPVIIHGAAIRFVNRLPLNSPIIEVELVTYFENAAYAAML